MARKKKRGGGRRKIIRIAAVAGTAGGAKHAYDRYQASGISGAIEAYTGYNTADGTFNFLNASSMHATLAGALVSMIFAKTGLNRYLPKGIGG